jgi:hypothetical protein
MDSADFLNSNPKFLMARFFSINRFVWDTLIPDHLRQDLIGHKKKSERKQEFTRLKSISNEASILVYIFLLRKFFKDGSEAAKSAVDTFKELNVDGFYIGSNYFSGRNDKVLQGEKIAYFLLESITDEKAKELIKNASHISDILEKYNEVIRKRQ